jgi:Legionella pneumophila major outer membrane protein precursor
MGEEKGIMKKFIKGAAALLTGLLAGTATNSRAQDLAPGSPNLPLPLYHARPETGGFFVSGGFSMYRQTNPMGNQTIAYRGFYAIDGTNLGPQVIIPPTTPGGVPTLAATSVPNGTFIGSMAEALNTNSVSGPSTYMPGFNISAGWKFEDESSLTLNYMWLAKANYASTASLIPSSQNIGATGADSYISSPVYGYPSQYAGPLNDVFAFADPALADAVTAAGGTVPTVNVPTDDSGNTLPLRGFATPGAGYGIWNAADFMTIQFTQRYQQLELMYRKPVYETDNYRMSALVGPKFVWIWERFKWIATDLNVFGNGSEYDSAAYTNIVSNRMYGANVGFAQEWYLGHGFSAQLDLKAQLFMNIVKERAKYEFDYQRNATPISKRSQTEYTVVPGLQPTIGINWYPVEGIEFKINYDIMMYWNTIASPNPVNFGWGNLDPTYQSTFRILDGFNAGLALVF